MKLITRNKEWLIANAEYRKKYKREYYIKNKKSINAKNAKWKLENKHRTKITSRAGHLRRTYKLTLDQYAAMIKQQNNLCALCNQPLDLTINHTVDHDHRCCCGEKSCGKCVRGILHDECNRYIALIEKKPELLSSALKYIRFNLTPTPIQVNVEYEPHNEIHNSCNAGSMSIQPST